MCDNGNIGSPVRAVCSDVLQSDEMALIQIEETWTTDNTFLTPKIVIYLDLATDVYIECKSKW